MDHPKPSLGILIAERRITVSAVSVLLPPSTPGILADISPASAVMASDAHRQLRSSIQSKRGLGGGRDASNGIC